MSLDMIDLVCCIARSVLIGSSLNLPRGGGGGGGGGGGVGGRGKWGEDEGEEFNECCRRRILSKLRLWILLGGGRMVQRCRVFYVTGASN